MVPSLAQRWSHDWRNGGPITLAELQLSAVDGAMLGPTDRVATDRPWHGWTASVRFGPGAAGYAYGASDGLEG